MNSCSLVLLQCVVPPTRDSPPWTFPTWVLLKGCSFSSQTAPAWIPSRWCSVSGANCCSVGPHGATGSDKTLFLHGFPQSYSILQVDPPAPAWSLHKLQLDTCSAVDILRGATCRGRDCLIIVFARGSRGSRISALVSAGPHSPTSSLTLLSAEFFHSHIFIPLSQQLLYRGVFHSFLIMLSQSCYHCSWWTQLWPAVGASESLLGAAAGITSQEPSLQSSLLSKPCCINPNTLQVLSSPLYLRAYLKKYGGQTLSSFGQGELVSANLHFLQNTAQNRWCKMSATKIHINRWPTSVNIIVILTGAEPQGLRGPLAYCKWWWE